MPRRGDNLPGFVARQLDFAAHIREPERQPCPADIDARRMQVYVDLFYNNIESLLASAFPVAKATLGAARWQERVRGFIRDYGCTSPYFAEVSQEFLTYISELDDESLPGFIIELCHYEWVELALSVADEELPVEGIDPEGDLLAGVVVRSPLIWALSYQYPVHRIGPDHQPAAPDPHPTHLVVVRRRDDSVGFLEVNGLTRRLLEMLDGDTRGCDALARIAGEVEPGDAVHFEREGVATLERLRKAHALLGVRTQPGEAG
jgi:uncharacterized protein